MAEKIPSSVIDGSRPTRARMRWYSSAVRPCAAMSAGVTFARLPACGRRLGPGAGSFLRARVEDFFDVGAMPVDLVSLTHEVRFGRPRSRGRNHAACLK